MSKPTPRPTLLLILIGILLVFLSFAAIASGLALLADPSGAGIQSNLELLKNTPFRDWTLPGLFLVCAYGIGSLIVLAGLVLRPRFVLFDWITRLTGHHWGWSLAVLLGAGLTVWVVYQFFTLPETAPVQFITLAIGIGVFVLAVLPAMRRYYRA